MLYVSSLSESILPFGSFAGEGRAAESGIYLRVMSKSLQALAATKNMVALDSCGSLETLAISLLRSSHAAMEAAACIEDRNEDVEEERRELCEVFSEATRNLLTGLIEQSRVASGELTKCEDELRVLKLLQKERTNLAGDGLDPNVDLEVEIDTMTSKKNEAKNALEESVSSVSKFVCEGLVQDWFVEDAPWPCFCRSFVVLPSLCFAFLTLSLNLRPSSQL